jgi:hypothetical protein
VKWAALVNLSTTVRIMVLPSDEERPMTSPGIYVTRDGEGQEEDDGGQPELADESYSGHRQCRRH